MTPSLSRPIGNLFCGFWLCAAALLAGCASTQSVIVGEESARDGDLSAADVAMDIPAEQLRHRSLGVRTGSTPSFYADTPDRRTFGILGVIAMMREGNRLVSTYGLEDPAGPLSEDLVAALALQNEMKTTSQDAADLLLDVKTINWDFRPYRNDPNSLFVVYSARVSLIERSSGSILAQGKCRSQRDREGDSATVDELLADGARRLQVELREAALECANRMKHGTLSAYLPGVSPIAPIAQQSGTAAVARR